VDDQALAQLAVDALYLALRLAGPALAACVVTSLVVGFLQAATQAHDSSLNFVPKLAAVGGTLLLCQAFLADELVHFSAQIFHHVAQVAR
jgi:flagellar biosynthetic protein FliQ